MLKNLLTIAAIIATAPVSAAEIEILTVQSYDHTMVLVSGEVVEGDASRFHDVVEGIDRATVVLQGPGGLIDVAFSIGAEINLRNYATMVVPDTECYSACALIWLAGKRRYTSTNAVIGVHAAYYEGENGTLNISGVGNAEIGAYLANIGLRREAIRYITTSEPDEEFLYLTPEIARALGIEIFEQDGLNTTTPSEAPTVPRIAYDVAKMIAFEANCGPLLETGGQAQRTAEAYLRRGHDEYGGEILASLISEAVEATKSAVASDGQLTWCLDTSTSLLEAGFDLGIDGPSFDCARATTTNEHAICDTPALWGLDRALAAVYSLARSQRRGADLSRLKKDQVAWLSDRQACSSDFDCSVDLYYRRIFDLLQ